MGTEHYEFEGPEIPGPQMEVRTMVAGMQQRYFEIVRTIQEQWRLAGRFPSRDAILYFLDYSLHHTADRTIAVLHNQALQRLGLLTEETAMPEPLPGAQIKPMVTFTEQMTPETYMEEIRRAYDLRLAGELTSIAQTQGWDAHQLCYSLALPSPLQPMTATQDMSLQ